MNDSRVLVQLFAILTQTGSCFIFRGFIVFGFPPAVASSGARAAVSLWFAVSGWWRLIRQRPTACVHTFTITRVTTSLFRGGLEPLTRTASVSVPNEVNDLTISLTSHLPCSLVIRHLCLWLTAPRCLGLPYSLPPLASQPALQPAAQIRLFRNRLFYVRNWNVDCFSGRVNRGSWEWGLKPRDWLAQGEHWTP